MKKTEQLNPTESLHIISEAIGKTKENIKEQSFYYIIWGWLIAIASFGQYLLINYTNISQNYLPWYILIPTGWIISIVYSIKKEKVKQYHTYFEVFLKNLWLVLGVTFMVSVYMSLTLQINPTIFILLLAAIGTIVSGLTMKFNPLIIGGLILFSCAIIALYTHGSSILLLNSFAISAGYLIPAYMLKKSK